MFIFHLRPEFLTAGNHERLGLLCTSFESYTGVKVHPNLGLILFLYLEIT
jgi:hypothetical protein